MHILYMRMLTHIIYAIIIGSIPDHGISEHTLKEFMLHQTVQTFNTTLTSNHQGSVGSTTLHGLRIRKAIDD